MPLMPAGEYKGFHAPRRYNNMAHLQGFHQKDWA
jgi:hypothetical protein